MAIALLSPELLVKVFQQLPFTDRFRYQRVCKLWNQILRTNNDVFKLDLGQIYADKKKNCILIRKDIKGDPTDKELESKLKTNNFDVALLAILERTATFLSSFTVHVDSYDSSGSFANDGQLCRDIVNVFERQSPVALKSLDLTCLKTEDVGVAVLKRIVSLCSSLQDLSMFLNGCNVAAQDSTWSILETVSPIECLKLDAEGFHDCIPSDQTLDAIHLRLGPSLKRLDWSPKMDQVGRFLCGFPHLQDLTLFICPDQENWDSVFDAIITRPHLERLLLNIVDHTFHNGVTSGLKRLFDSSQRLKLIRLDHFGLDSTVLLDLMDHWSRSHSLSATRPELRVEVTENYCHYITRAELAEMTLSPGVTVVYRDKDDNVFTNGFS